MSLIRFIALESLPSLVGAAIVGLTFGLVFSSPTGLLVGLGWLASGSAQGVYTATRMARYLANRTN
jgi:hypothetical protein